MSLVRAQSVTEERGESNLRASEPKGERADMIDPPTLASQPPGDVKGASQPALRRSTTPPHNALDPSHALASWQRYTCASLRGGNPASITLAKQRLE